MDATQAAPAPQLRPLGVGDIVDRVFALYRAQPILFIAIATVPYLILVLVIVGLGLAFATTFIGLISVMNQAAEGRTMGQAIDERFGERCALKKAEGGRGVQLDVVR